MEGEEEPRRVSSARRRGRPLPNPRRRRRERLTQTRSFLRKVIFSVLLVSCPRQLLMSASSGWTRGSNPSGPSATAEVSEGGDLSSRAGPCFSDRPRPSSYQPRHTTDQDFAPLFRL